MLLSFDGIRYMGSFMPFSIERQMALPYAKQLPKPNDLARRLDLIAMRVAIALGVPPDIPIEVRVIDHDAVQAFGTLGGYIVVYRGMLQALDSEAELAALLAHQIAHIMARHQSDALGNRVNAGILLSPLSQDLAAEIAAPSFGDGLRTAPRFSRLHERHANAASAEALASMYGNVGGVVALSNKLRSLMVARPGKLPNYVSTHPEANTLTPELQQLASEKGWKLDGEREPKKALPLWLTQALSATPTAETKQAAPQQK